MAVLAKPSYPTYKAICYVKGGSVQSAVNNTFVQGRMKYVNVWSAIPASECCPLSIHSSLTANLIFFNFFKR